MCRFKGNFEGKWRQVVLDGNCANFYPSTNFKLSLYETRLIPLTRKKFAIVDAEDYYRLSKFNWRAVLRSHTVYASTRHAGKTIPMHRLIMDAPDHLVVDHIDHNGLNNCKSNLRLCTIAQNTRNALPNKGTSSRYKGVGWHKGMRKWAVQIHHNDKRYRLGYFTDEIDAAKAYDEKAKVFHREFAHLNFPQEAG